MSIRIIFSLTLLLLLTACKSDKKAMPEKLKSQKEAIKIVQNHPKGVEVPDGMVWIPGGKFHQGAIDSDKMAMAHEKPRHEVQVDGFFMDIHPVTNNQFRQFVKATGYKTVAEQGVSWEELKKQVPEGTPKPHDSILQPGSLIFKKTTSSVPNLYDYSQWWKWKIGADWKHPNGPKSSIEGIDDYPVVHIAYDDALAYCEWADRRLPTEAEWEYAARANQKEAIFFWGNDHDQLSANANTWEGEFPVANNINDGYESRAPVMTYPRNAFGLYGMAGNVWEWTSDWYNVNYYEECLKKGLMINPQGASVPYNPSLPYAKQKIIKGGSFLCSNSYCASYRISSRMAISLDSSVEHLGFRTVKFIVKTK